MIVGPTGETMKPVGQAVPDANGQITLLGMSSSRVRQVRADAPRMPGVSQCKSFDRLFMLGLFVPDSFSLPEIAMALLRE